MVGKVHNAIHAQYRDLEMRELSCSDLRKTKQTISNTIFVRTEDKVDLLNHLEIIDAPSPQKFEHQIMGTIEDRVYLETDGRILYKNRGELVSAH